MRAALGCDLRKRSAGRPARSRRGKFRKLHRGHQVFENLLAGTVDRQLLPQATANLIKTGNFLQALAQGFVDLLAFEPHLQVTRDRIDKPLLLRHQEWLVRGIEYLQMPADLAVDAYRRLQRVR